MATTLASAAAEAAATVALSRSFASRYGATVNWFPGHMAATTRRLAELCHAADILLEVRDARLPFTSANPLLNALARQQHQAGGGTGSSSNNNTNNGQKPRIVVFNKADLANDQLQTRIAAYERRRGFIPVFTSAANGGTLNVGTILKHVDSIPTRASKFQSAGTLLVVLGLPNVGKSSLINSVREVTGCKESRGAATAPTPGFTRSITSIRVRSNPLLYLCDSPGVMMPKVNDVESGLKLVVTGAVKDTSVPFLVQAEYLLYIFEMLGATRYVSAAGLSRAYGADEVEEAMKEIAARRGLRRGGGTRVENGGSSSSSGKSSSNRSSMIEGGVGQRGVHNALFASSGDSSFTTSSETDLDLREASRQFVRMFQAGELGRYTLDYIPPT